jgi:ketosteroid isomerase-like protein
MAQSGGLGLIIAAAMSPAQASDKEANAVYERLTASYASLDPAGLERVYAPNATYSSRNPGLTIHDRKTLMKGLTGFQQQVKDKGGAVDIRFRIVERKRFGNLYVDHGYVRTAYTLGKDAAPTVTNGKFMTVLMKQPEGHWAIVSDADSEAPADAYERAAAVDGLKFDR